MILLTRLNGPVFALNPDLVERADCTPDTVVTLVDGTKYVIAESLPEFVALIRQYRATVVADAQHLVGQAGAPVAPDPLGPAGSSGLPGLSGTGSGQGSGSSGDPSGEDNVFHLHRREH